MSKQIIAPKLLASEKTALRKHGVQRRGRRYPAEDEAVPTVLVRLSGGGTQDRPIKPDQKLDRGEGGEQAPRTCGPEHADDVTAHHEGAFLQSFQRHGVQETPLPLPAGRDGPPLSENMGLIFGTRTRKKFYNRK